MPKTSLSRRSFVGTAAGIAGAFWAEDKIQAYQNHVNTNSKPSDLKITDMRIAVLARALGIDVEVFTEHHAAEAWLEEVTGNSDTGETPLPR